MVEFIRARSPDQKTERRAHLLHTAQQMLEEGTSVADLSLNALARRAEMTKSNVYRYFESREAMLLEVLTAEWLGWFDAVRADLARQRARLELPDLVTLLVDAIVARPLMCLLTSVVPSVLEQNVSVDVVRAFKQGSMATLDEVAAVIVDHCPALTTSAARTLLDDVLVLVVGLYPLAHPAPAVVEALQDPALCRLAHHFDADLRRLALAVAESLVRRSSSV